MSLKKLLFATLASAIIMIVLGGLWHTVIMADFYAEGRNVVRDEPLMGFVAVGMFVLALLMSYVYPRGASHLSPVAGGARFGAVMGLVYVLPHGLVLHGIQSDSTATLVLVDAIWHVVEQGVGGIAIALVYAAGAGEAEMPA
jgi:hypothetical protein